MSLFVSDVRNYTAPSPSHHAVYSLPHDEWRAHSRTETSEPRRSDPRAGGPLSRRSAPAALCDVPAHVWDHRRERRRVRGSARVGRARWNRGNVVARAPRVWRQRSRRDALRKSLRDASHVVLRARFASSHCLQHDRASSDRSVRGARGRRCAHGAFVFARGHRGELGQHVLWLALGCAATERRRVGRDLRSRRRGARHRLSRRRTAEPDHARDGKLARDDFRNGNHRELSSSTRWREWWLRQRSARSGRGRRREHRSCVETWRVVRARDESSDCRLHFARVSLLARVFALRASRSRRALPPSASTIASRMPRARSTWATAPTHAPRFNRSSGSRRTLRKCSSSKKTTTSAAAVSKAETATTRHASG